MIDARGRARGGSGERVVTSATNMLSELGVMLRPERVDVPRKSRTERHREVLGLQLAGHRADHPAQLMELLLVLGVIWLSVGFGVLGLCLAAQRADSREGAQSLQRAVHPRYRPARIPRSRQACCAQGRLRSARPVGRRSWSA